MAQFNIYLDDDLLSRIKAYSKDNEMTTAGFFRLSAKKYLERVEKDASRLD